MATIKDFPALSFNSVGGGYSYLLYYYYYYYIREGGYSVTHGVRNLMNGVTAPLLLRRETLGTLSRDNHCGTTALLKFYNH